MILIIGELLLWLESNYYFELIIIKINNGASYEKSNSLINYLNDNR